jgi:hypothetical protein
MMLWVLGWACTTEVVSVYTTVDQEDRTQVEEDTAYLADVESTEAPSIHEIEMILQMGIDQIRETRVSRLLDVYDEMLDQTDDYCPRWFNNPDGMYWADTCTSENGVSFQGFATSMPRNDLAPDDYGNMFMGRQIHCEGTLTQGDTTMQCVGGINELTGTDANGHDVFYSYSRHYVLTEGDTVTHFPDAEMWAVNTQTYKALFQNGVQIVREGEHVLGAVEFGRQTMTNADCLREPNGTQHIQVNGQWIYVEWQGEQSDDSDTCDGCGDAYAQGVSIGSVCADFSGWLAWDESPFE